MNPFDQTNGINLPQLVSTWAGVQVAPSRFGGVEFTLGPRELGHIYSDGLLHLSFNKDIRQQLVCEGKAQTHALYPDSGWVSFEICTAAQSYHALWLLQLALEYHRIRQYRQNPTPDLRADILQHLMALHLSETLTKRFEELINS